MTIQYWRFLQLAGVTALASATLSWPAMANPAYTQDGDLASFTATVQDYATFTNGNMNPAMSLPYTPTTAILSAPDYPRIIGASAVPVVAQFDAPVSQILVFNNVDHVGYAWDAYQYKIYGSNDGSSYSLLFDPQSVNEPDNGSSIATPFTLATWTGTAPTLVNNTLTPGLGSWVGTIGYEAYFDFGSSAYSYFEFLPSSLAVTVNQENELELSAVARAEAPIPEPASMLLLGSGFAASLAASRRRRTPRTACSLVPAVAGA